MPRTRRSRDDSRLPRSAPCGSFTRRSAGSRKTSTSTRSTRPSRWSRWPPCASTVCRRTRSTSTAAPARWAIRSGPRAGASWSHCSARCASWARSGGWPACASAAARRPRSRSSSPDDKAMADKLVFESPPVTLQLGRRTARPAVSRRRRDPFPVIVGCPRSGTSLLAVMLDAHSQLAIPPETAFLPNVMGLTGDPESLRRRFFDIVTADRMTISNWSDFGLDKEALWRRLQEISVFTVAAGTRAFYELYGEGQRKPRSGDKTPGYVFMMQHIQALLPEAHFIHVIRDPRDTAMSWRKTWFAP